MTGESAREAVQAFANSAPMSLRSAKAFSIRVVRTEAVAEAEAEADGAGDASGSE